MGGTVAGTTVTQIEQAFQDFTTRRDVAIVLITQNVRRRLRRKPFSFLELRLVSPTPDPPSCADC